MDLVVQWSFWQAGCWQTVPVVIWRSRCSSWRARSWIWAVLLENGAQGFERMFQIPPPLHLSPKLCCMWSLRGDELFPQQRKSSHKGSCVSSFLGWLHVLLSLFSQEDDSSCSLIETWRKMCWSQISITAKAALAPNLLVFVTWLLIRDTYYKAQFCTWFKLKS